MRELQANHCYAINSNLEPDWMRPNSVTRTTSYIHGHQTLFLLRLKTRMLVCSLAGQPLRKELASGIATHRHTRAHARANLMCAQVTELFSSTPFGVGVAPE